jgi:hypothetical protein
MDRRNMELYQKATWESLVKHLMLYRNLRCRSFEDLENKIKHFMLEDKL